MAACKLTSSIKKGDCNYSLAGIKAIYLINYDYTHNYKIDETTGKITEISLADSEKLYQVDFVDNTASFTDDLAQNGNGGKYRTHTLNFSLSNYDYEMLNQSRALSLGTFTAVVVDRSDRALVLGRNNGLNATAFNYASGAADADASAWTVTMAGSELEVARLLSDITILDTMTIAKSRITITE